MRSIILGALLGISSAAGAAAQSGDTGEIRQPKTIVIPKSTPLESIQAQCAGMVIIKVDDQFQCQSLPPESLDNIIKAYQAMDLEFNPIDAGKAGDRDALRRLPDVGPEAGARQLAAMQDMMRRYQNVDGNVLKGQDLLNYKLLGYVLDRRLSAMPFDDGRIPFTNDSGFFNMMSYVSRGTTFASVDDYDAYVQRLSQIPRYFAQNMANMRRGIETGFTASAQIVPGILETVQGLSKGAPDDHPFYAPFKSFPASISKAEQSRLAALGRETIARDIQPSYVNLAAFLETEYLPKSRQTPGIGINEDGKAYYAAMARHHTTLNMTPDEIHQLGLDEVSRIRAEMDAVIAKTGYKGDFKSFLKFLRTDEQFYAKSADELLKEAAYIAKRIDGKMPEYFATLPRLPYGVLAVPDEIAPQYTTGRYWGGNPVTGKAGNYMVNTYNLKQRPLYNLPALTLHEGVPGHHHQIALAQEQTDVPKFRQSLYPTAFGEGWGLYAEKLGKEMGIYQNPYEEFGRLTYEMWRACRLVVDTGMHWKGWSREQAEACFLENSALAPHNVRTEVDRYISWPGQALAYKIGELKIWELRRRAEAALGNDFDVRTFHDAVLVNGGLPLTILEQQIDNWIAKQRAD